MKNKHLTYADRVLIEDLLNRGNANLTTIAKTPFASVVQVREGQHKCLLTLHFFN